MLHLLLLILPSLIFTSPLYAGLPGTLDPTFGKGGTLYTDLGLQEDTAGVAVQKDGRVILLARLPNVSALRYLKNGTLDQSFGNKGVVNGLGGVFYDVAVRQDGKILLAGEITAQQNANYFLVRLKADGTPDPTFGNNGSVLTDFGLGTDDWAVEIVLQADGKIILGGTSRKQGQAFFSLARYKSNGSLDQNFGTGGKVTTKVAKTAQLEVTAMALQEDDHILLTGYWDDMHLRAHPTLVRYTPSGNLDPHFGGGIVTITRDERILFYDLAVQIDGKIVVVGVTFTKGFERPVIARFEPDGQLDQDFGKTGLIIMDTNDSANARSVVLQKDSKIVFAGEMAENFFVTRFLRTGFIDKDFGNGGIVLTKINGNKFSEAIELIIQQDCKILAVGNTEKNIPNFTNPDFALARYYSGLEDTALCRPNRNKGTFESIAPTGNVLSPNDLTEEHQLPEGYPIELPLTEPNEDILWYQQPLLLEP